eukprot:m.228176 g.228176  ORF g.228176 m.228176 type:complete len:201 (+) comp17416_c0_seq1:2-604(+)
MFDDAPTGYTEAVHVLNSIPQDLFVELANDVLDFLSYKVGAISLQAFHTRLQHSGSSLSLDEVTSASRALSYVFREAIAGGATAEALVTALRSAGASVWTSQAIKVVGLLWGERGADAVAIGKAQNVLKIGQLVKFEWRLGLAVSSSSVKSINRVYVAVALTVADAASRTAVHAFEMSYPEFQSFAKHLRDMAGALDMCA